MQKFINIKGAREHNLKNIDVSIPRQAITVITGPSGSGKSSLAIDTIYAEGQRRYVESLSAYSRQFLEQLSKPDVDFIEGLSPSIAIDQKTVSRSPRSTLGTITEIYDYLRVLYTRVGKPFCYNCGAEISTQGSGDVMQAILSLPEGTRIQVLAPIVKDRKGNYRKELQEMRNEGFVRARIDNVMADLTQEIILEKKKRHTIEIVIDRLIIKDGIERQLRDAVDTAFKYSDTVVTNLLKEDRDILFSRTTACPRCGISYPEISPRFFSFNSKAGACPTCNGLGFRNISEDAVDLEEQIFCRTCHGFRLRPEALSVKFMGINIGELSRMAVSDVISFLEKLKLTEREGIIASRILKEVRDRLSFLKKVGLGYLTLDRPSLTLSGGEAQRIRLATQMGSSLTGVLYVLDEPSIGLHPRDCTKLLDSLSSIRDADNTIIIVEHDDETIRWADHVIDMGPGAGVRGGWIVAVGTPEQIEKNERSLTGQYLSGSLAIEIPSSRRRPVDFIEIKDASEHNLKHLDVNIPLKLFTCVTGVSGSGKSTLIFDILYRAAEKKLSKGLDVGSPGKYREIAGLEMVDRVISVDQAPIGRTPRSNPATYTGFFSFIRDLFAMLAESKVRGYKTSRFSFNVSGGRCESCKGNGMIKVEMHFLPNVYVECDKCKGRRYNAETLEIRYKGKNIADVLDMTVSEALKFFENIPNIRRRLELLDEIGLGYLRLGQPATTLSGGEAQRIRLSRELGRKASGKTLYIFDEPTTGLHFVDIQKLLDVLNLLVDQGNTVVVIEHNLDIIKSADYIIDLGPEGGEAGGEVVAEGTPDEVADNEASYTGKFLKEKLAMGRLAGVTA
ncbi:Excinuclease ABC, subunit A [Candidatus Sulfobium mesophilum]|uniref:UvrABC system protein A n=1 Tax=Candidatus Sulfobium mesophilum TaxID=2016548 RepID=A0A2U3QG74_9BACT|nr:Excinuclease ABC, subunit A [Candidatus Sulfobium mesophilum]